MNREATFTIWVNTYMKDLLRWAQSRLPDRELARDLVQDTFAVAFEQMDRFEGKSNPKTWLTGILKNKIADYYRSAYQRPQTSLSRPEFFTDSEAWNPAEVPLEDWNSSGELLDQEPFRKVLENCMERLSPVWRQAMSSRYLDEKEAPAICQDLGLSQTNYWQILHRSKLQLRKCLEINWFSK
jgi:RNA polymerase sigma-70 factor (TIGR02943 family)